MIQTNVVTNTKGGAIIPSGALLNIRPTFVDRLEDVFDEDGEKTGVVTKYDIQFDVDIYESMNEYEEGDTYTKDYVDQYNIGFLAVDVNIQALDSISSMLAIYQNHIENGDGGQYSGIGSGKTAIVFPTT